MSSAYFPQEMNIDRFRDMLVIWAQFEPDIIQQVGKSFNFSEGLVLTPSLMNDIHLNRIFIAVMSAALKRELTLTVVPLPGANNSKEVRLSRGSEVLVISILSTHVGYAALDAYSTYLWRCNRNHNYDTSHKS